MALLAFGWREPPRAKKADEALQHRIAERLAQIASHNSLD
jgi:hypothetical protein